MIIVIVKKIQVNEYRKLVARCPLEDFIQTPENNQRLAAEGRQVRYCKVVDGREVIAVLVFYEWPTPFGVEYECLQGPVMLYDDLFKVEAVITSLHQYVRQQGGIRLRLQLPLCEARGEDGAALQLDEHTGDILLMLERLGFRRTPSFMTDKNDRYQQWFFVKNINNGATYEEIVATLSSKTRRDIRAALRQGVKVRLAKTERDIDSVATLMMATGERRQFDGRSRQFYHTLHKAFPGGNIMYILAEVNKKNYCQQLQERIKSLDGLIETASTDTTARDLCDQQRAAQQRMEIIKDSDADSDMLPLAAAIFIHIDRTMIYFLSASDKRFAFLGAPYAIQDRALQMAAERDVWRYNFYGTNGAFNGRPEQEGVYRFKKGFGGQLERRVGCYDFTIKPIHCVIIDGIRRVRVFIRDLHR